MSQLPLWPRPQPAPPTVPVAPKTLAEARQEYLRGLREGVDCPCCHRFGKIYRRKFNARMALCMIALYRLDVKESGRWVHVASEIPYAKRGSDYGMLPYWRFVEEHPEEKDDHNPHNGQYRITFFGREFVLGRLRVRKYLYTYNNHPMDVDEAEARETTDIKEALWHHFKYDELITG